MKLDYLISFYIENFSMRGLCLNGGKFMNIIRTESNVYIHIEYIGHGATFYLIVVFQ